MDNMKEDEKNKSQFIKPKNLIKDILKELNNFQNLKYQYLFYECFIISSKEINQELEEAKKRNIKNLDKVKFYYTPDYLHILDSKNKIFYIKNNNNFLLQEKFYFLKEHIFYYSFLETFVKLKKENKSNNENKESINEIFYRTLLNRLYALETKDNESNINFGISKIFGCPCIYSIIEKDIVQQIINMKKIKFEDFNIEENEFKNLFGVNEDIDRESFIYSEILSSISSNNSSIIKYEGNNIDEMKDLFKKNNILQKYEKNLIDISTELFLFNYITKQFEKDKLIQIPKIIFFSNLYYNDDNENKNYENIKKLYDGQKNNNCKIASFVGLLEVDGSFKYIGDKDIQIKTDSLKLVIYEDISYKSNNDVKKFIQNLDKRTILYHLSKYKDKKEDINNILKKIKKHLKLYSSSLEDIIDLNNSEINESINYLEKEIKSTNLNKDLIINIKRNDILLFENKRKYSNKITDEIQEFLEHTFYFINLYNNLNLINNDSTIHLFFVYDHSRNYEDKDKAYIALYNFIQDNELKISLIFKKIKFYLIHSLPNLPFFIIGKLENDINILKNQINVQNNDIITLNNRINELNAQIQNNDIITLKEQNAILNNKINELNAQFNKIFMLNLNYLKQIESYEKKK